MYHEQCLKVIYHLFTVVHLTHCLFNSGENQVYYQKLHALHKFRRQRKRVSERDMVISCVPRARASIVNRQDLYYRFGEKEQEAVACFDFLEEFSFSSNSSNSADHKEACSSNNDQLTDEEKLLVSSCFSVQTSTANESTTMKMITSSVDHISLSDSCAESCDGSDVTSRTSLSYAT